jgi:hypothetical protein
MSEDAENTKITKKKRSTANGKFHRIYGRLLEGIQEQIDIAVISKILQDQTYTMTGNMPYPV